MAFLSSKLFAAAAEHDYDKLTEIDWFYEDFKTKFEQTDWWETTTAKVTLAPMFTVFTQAL